MKNEYKKIVVEGSDLIGKSTISTYLGKVFGDVSDRDFAITDNVLVEQTDKEIQIVKDYIMKEENNDTLFVFLLVPLHKSDELLGTRLAARKKAGKSDEFDEHCIEYNASYTKTVAVLKDAGISNMLVVNVDEFRNPYSVLWHISKTIVEHVLRKIDFNA